jgi:hypothetical protein
MTQRVKVTKRQAEQVLARVRSQFKVWLPKGAEGPVLRKDWDWGYGPVPYAITWEGGPYDWAALSTAGGRDEEFGFKVEPITYEQQRELGVFLEPYTSWALGIYQAWS